MIIRPATQQDSAAIADCLLLAMQNIVKLFLATDDPNAARRFMSHFTALPGNQYSFENCQIALIDGKVVGAINVYDGAHLDELRKPVMDYIRENHNPTFAPEDETGPGEYYIDTLGVLPEHRLKGIATALLQSSVEHFVHRNRSTLSLLVAPYNDKAKRLYLNLGFQPVGTKILMGETLEHLQYPHHG